MQATRGFSFLLAIKMDWCVGDLLAMPSWQIAKRQSGYRVSIRRENADTVRKQNQRQEQPPFWRPTRELTKTGCLTRRRADRGVLVVVDIDVGVAAAYMQV